MTDNSRNSNKNFEQPDLNDLEDDSAIPTYKGPSPSANSSNASDRLGKIYDRSGRAAPQNIPPVGETQASETAAFERPDQQTNVTPAEEHTTVHKAASASNDSLASDAPTSYVQAQPAQPLAAPTEATRQLSRPEQPVYASEPYTDSDFAPAGAAAAGTTSAAGATAFSSDPAFADAEYSEQPQIIQDARRGTLDFGLLIIRVVIGVYLIVRGVFTFFTLGGSGGLAGLEAEFSGYVWPEILSILLPSIELAAGVFLLLGLMTPVAAAVATVATSFTTLHQINLHEGGWGQLDEPIMLALILTVVVVGLQFTGPGKISLDSGRGWAKRPLASSWVFVIIGIAGAVLLWWFGAGVNPIA